MLNFIACRNLNYSLALVAMAAVPLPPAPVARCLGAVVLDSSGGGYIDCLAPCSAGCVAIVHNVGPLTYAVCACYGQPESPCCKVGIDLTQDPPGVILVGDCSAQTITCPTGSWCHETHTTVGDTTVYIGSCAD